MVRRENVSIFLDAKASTTILQVKQMIHGISKKPPEDQQLIWYKENKILEDNKTLGDYGITSQIAKAQSPTVLAVQYRNDAGEFETVGLTPFSQPPEPPVAMKPQDSSIISG